MGKNANAGKVTSVFSPSLFKQDLRSNIVLIVVVLVLMVLISNVVNIATHVLSESEQKTTEAQEQAQEDFFVYLSGLAAYDAMSGQDLSFEDFEATSDHEPYETAFSLVNESLDLDEELSFLSGFVVLGAIAVVTYLVGAVRFYKKDLPL